MLWEVKEVIQTVNTYWVHAENEQEAYDKYFYNKDLDFQYEESDVIHTDVKLIKSDE